MDTSAPDMVRLDARIPRQLYLQIKRAAEIEGVTITEFLTHILREASEEVIAKGRTIRLMPQDQKRFAEALIDPPEANAIFADAILRYKGINHARRD